MIKRNLRYLLNPLILGTILSVIIISVIAFFIPKYYFGIVEESVLNNRGEIYFSDLNNDGNSEKINYNHYDKIFQPTIYLYDSGDKFKALWNFNESPVNNSRIYSGDYNNDSIKEIFIFTEKNDSLFLYVLNPEDDSGHIRNFISVIREKSDELKIITLGLFKSEKASEKELFFIVDAGYPNKPIELFSYNISANSLKSSPEINAKIIEPIITNDINKDGNTEVIISNQSVHISDSKAQLIILKNDLSYLFNPVGFQGTESKITSDIVDINDKSYIAAMNSGTSEENVFNNLMLYDFTGNRISEKAITGKSNLEIISNPADKESVILFSGYKLFLYNNNFKKTRSFSVNRKDKVKFISSIDVAGDGKPEYLFKSNDQLVIVSEDLRSKSVLKIPGNGPAIINVLQKVNNPNQLSVQIGDRWYLLDYYRNTAFFSNQILYILIFLVVTFLIFLMFSLRRRKLSLIGKVKDDIYKEVKENIEDRISGFESKLNKIKGEFKEDKLVKAIDEIESAFTDVRSLAEEVKVDLNRKVDLYKSITELGKENRSNHKINISLYPEVGWDDTRPETEQAIIKFCDLLIKKINELSRKLTINIQLINHKDYLNMLIEIENLYEENNGFKNNKELIAILKKVNGKYNVDTFSDFGTVINADIPFDSFSPVDSKSSKGKIRVIIAEDHDVSLFGLVSLFKTKDEIEITGTAKNGMEVLKILETKETDVVITDISMPGMDGIELSEKLQNDFPKIKVIVFTMYMENWFVEQLLNFGARGFVSKNSKITELISAVKYVYEGNNYYCPQFKSKFGFKNNGNGNGNGNQLDSLTKNELLIIKFYAENLLKEQIAKKMNLSMEIMDSFIANIMLKLKAGDEDEIIRIAKKQKFISD